MEVPSLKSGDTFRMTGRGGYSPKSHFVVLSVEDDGTVRAHDMREDEFDPKLRTLFIFPHPEALNGENGAPQILKT